jgi:hypothetical protein
MGDATPLQGACVIRVLDGGVQWRAFPPETGRCMVDVDGLCDRVACASSGAAKLSRRRVRPGRAPASTKFQRRQVLSGHGPKTRSAGRRRGALGTSLVPNASSDASRTSRGGDAWDDGDTRGRIHRASLRLKAGRSQVQILSPRLAGKACQRACFRPQASFRLCLLGISWGSNFCRRAQFPPEARRTLERGAVILATNRGIARSGEVVADP